MGIDSFGWTEERKYEKIMYEACRTRQGILFHHTCPRCGKKNIPQSAETRILFDRLKEEGMNVIEEFCCDGHIHVDLAIPERKLFIEVDKKEPNGKWKERDECSRNHAYRTLRIKNAEVRKNIEGAVDKVKKEAEKPLLKKRLISYTLQPNGSYKRRISEPNSPNIIFDVPHLLH